MTAPDSPILDFYPLEVKKDLNGKKADWEAVVLIPFIDERRLLDALATKGECIAVGWRGATPVPSVFMALQALCLLVWLLVLSLGSLPTGHRLFSHAPPSMHRAAPLQGRAPSQLPFTRQKLHEGR